MAVLRKELGDELAILRTPHYPYEAADRRLRRGEEEAWLGIGGNLGDVPRRFERLWHVLERERGIRPLESSPILRNPPFGYLEQPFFHNAVLRIATCLTPMRLLDRLLEFERRFGRKRSFKDAPRTLDLDLLFYGKRRIDHPRLQVPHPGWRERKSVTIPLSRMRDHPVGPAVYGTIEYHTSRRSRRRKR